MLDQRIPISYNYRGECNRFYLTATFADRETRESVIGHNPLVLLGFGIIAETLFLVLALNQESFFADDFWNLNAAKAKLSVAFLTRDVFGHFIPTFNLVNYVLMHLAPYNYSSLEVVDCIMFVALLCGFYRLLRAIGANPQCSLLLTMVLGLTPFFAPAFYWWSDGLSNMGSLAFSVIALDGFVRYRRTKHLRYAGIVFVAYTIALGLFETALLTCVVAVLLEVLVLRTTGRRSLFDHLPLIVAFLVPTAADFAYRFAHPQAYGLPGFPPVSEVLTYLRSAWFLAFGPTMVGADYPTRLLLSSQAFTVALGQLVVVAVPIGIIALRRSAWRAWSVFAVAFLLDMLAIVWQRGENAAFRLEYLTFAPVLFLLAVGTSFAEGTEWRARIGTQASRALSTTVPVLASRTGRGRPGLLLLGALVMAVIATSCVLDSWSIATMTDPLVSIDLFENYGSPHDARLYFDNVATSFANVKSRYKRVAILDGLIPESIVPGWLIGYRWESVAVTDLFPSIVFDRPAERTFTISSTGSLEPAAFHVLTSARLSNVSVVAGTATTTDPVPDVCISSGKPAMAIFPLGREPSNLDTVPGLLLKISYSTASNVRIFPSLASAQSSIPAVGQGSSIELRSGQHTLVENVASWPATRVIRLYAARRG